MGARVGVGAVGDEGVEYGAGGAADGVVCVDCPVGVGEGEVEGGFAGVVCVRHVRASGDEGVGGSSFGIVIGRVEQFRGVLEEEGAALGETAGVVHCAATFMVARVNICSTIENFLNDGYDGFVAHAEALLYRKQQESHPVGIANVEIHARLI